MYTMDQYTVSLLHFDTDLTDESGKTWTANGGASVSTAQSQSGGGSLYLDGTQYISTPMTTDFQLVSGDFTVDFWMYTGATGASGATVLFCTDVALVYSGINIHYIGTTIYGAISLDGSTWLAVEGTLTLNAWNHIAFVKHGNTMYLLVNNVKGTPMTISGTPIESSESYVTVGNMLGNVADFHFNGYIDELRVSNIARWTTEPSNLTATPGDSQVSLSWNAVTGASGYNVKRSTTAGGPYTTIASNVAATSYLDSTVTNGTTYYYVVTALIGGSESANSNEASATPQAQDGQVLLRITMSDSSEREYQLPMADAENFVQWCSRSVGTGTTCYVFNKIYNVGEFKNRKEYLMFDKIISFEIMELTK